MNKGITINGAKRGQRPGSAGGAGVAAITGTGTLLRSPVVPLAGGIASTLQSSSAMVPSLSITQNGRQLTIA